MKGVIHTSADFVRIKLRNPPAKGIMKNLYHISCEKLYAFFSANCNVTIHYFIQMCGSQGKWSTALCFGIGTRRVKSLYTAQPCNSMDSFHMPLLHQHTVICNGLDPQINLSNIAVA